MMAFRAILATIVFGGFVINPANGENRTARTDWAWLRSYRLDKENGLKVLSTLFTCVDSMSSVLAPIEDEIERDVKEKLANYTHAVNGKFDGVNTKIGELEAKIGAMEANVEDAKEAMANYSQATNLKLDQLNIRMDGVETSVNDKMEDMNRKLGNITAGQMGLQGLLLELTRAFYAKFPTLELSTTVSPDGVQLERVQSNDYNAIRKDVKEKY